MKMFSTKLFFLVFAYIIYSNFLIYVGESLPTYSNHICKNSTGTLTQNSTYLSNLNLLFSYFISNATTVDSGFYQTTIANSTPSGFFQCRGDVTAAVCRDCISRSSREVLQRCRLEKEAVIWYDMCWIWYEDQRASYSGLIILPMKNSASSETVTETNRFNELLASTMSTVAERAAYSGSVKKFATAETTFTSSLTLYSLAQCMSTLSSDDCNSCLTSAIGFFPGCCGGRRGGSVLLPSCITRYELYPFYNSTSTNQVRYSGNCFNFGEDILNFLFYV